MDVGVIFVMGHHMFEQGQRVGVNTNAAKNVIGFNMYKDMLLHL